VGRAIAATVLVLLIARGAAADPIVDRNYAIELYEGVAIGDSALTGMGGAGAANVLGSAGALINASAPAVRRTTDNDSWSWDYHLDFLSGQFSSDYDNNGVVAPQTGGAQLVTGGLSLRFGKWSGAITSTAQSAPVDGSANPALDAQVLRFKFVIARFFERADLALGVGIQSVSFQLLDIDDATTLFSLTGAGLEAGATWLPRGESYRVGVAVESRIIGSQVASSTCDPMACNPTDDPMAMTYILPGEVESPGRTIVGFAYRWAATEWNQQVETKYRDEVSVTGVADIVIAGSSANGYGIEAFAMQQLQRSGARVTVSPRAGVEVEALPSRLRLRTGTYWEPARFDGVAGRIHGTFGLELRALEFHLWGLRRGKLGATFDIARRYRNIGLSIGFWH